MRIIYYIFILITFTIVGCQFSGQHEDDIDTVDPDTIDIVESYIEIPVQNDTIIHFRYGCCFVVATQIKYPDGEPQGTIMMLKPYNNDFDDWCFSTDFCSKALQENYVLIIPNFGNTLYQFRHYNETIFDVRKFPDLLWITESYIPDIQSLFGLLLTGQRNFVAGLSSGGRGAILIANSLPDIFVGTASVSGYFNIPEYRNLSMFTDAYGDYDSFTERWENESFLIDRDNYSVPTYIAHGQSDFIVKHAYSMQLIEIIRGISEEVLIENSFPVGESHGFAYWKKETDNILDFFCKIR